MDLLIVVDRILGASMAALVLLVVLLSALLLVDLRGD